MISTTAFTFRAKKDNLEAARTIADALGVTISAYMNLALAASNQQYASYALAQSAANAQQRKMDNSRAAKLRHQHLPSEAGHGTGALAAPRGEPTRRAPMVDGAERRQVAADGQ